MLPQIIRLFTAVLGPDCSDSVRGFVNTVMNTFINVGIL
jgi:hypothetical protein